MYYNQQNYIRYTKTQYIEGLRGYVLRNTGIMPTREEKLEDIPEKIRHCCAYKKIIYLPRLNFGVPETGMNLPFYFCDGCGKLLYYKDFM